MSKVTRLSIRPRVGGIVPASIDDQRRAKHHPRSQTEKSWFHRRHGSPVYLRRHVSPSTLQLARQQARPNERSGERLLIAAIGDEDPPSPSPFPLSTRDIHNDYQPPSRATSLALAGWLGRKTKQDKIRNGVQSFRHAQGEYKHS